MTGSLQISKGIYQAVFYVPSASGKKKQKWRSTGIRAKGNNKRIAKRKMEEILKEYEDVTCIEDTERLLCDYMKYWIELDKPRVQATTYDGYIHMLKRHIYPYFKSKKITVQKLKPADLEEYYAFKYNEGLSANTINKHHSIIKTALHHAVKNGLIQTNPADLADKLKREKPKHDFYSLEEMKELLAVSKGCTIELPIYLALMFGLRRSEAIGLRWSDIDFSKKILTINNKVVRAVNEENKYRPLLSDKLKTDASNRVFPLSDAMVEYLSAIKAKQDLMSRTTLEYVDFVCVNDAGELLQPDYVTAKFRKILKHNHLRLIRFHDLRHSCCSFMVAEGFNMKLVQEWAGHANYQMTADTYSHVDISAKREMSDRISLEFNV